jgi:hypothetical protein
MKMDKVDVLKSIRMGQRVAEEEVDSLEEYFVETNQWNEIFDGHKDLVFGPKGAGKSALYTLLNTRSLKLRDRGILITLAENPKGATVFKNLEIDPPPSESAFILLWKLYALILVANTLRAEGIDNPQAKALINVLNKAGLLPTLASRESLFSSVRKLISTIFDKHVSSLETTVSIDAISGLPKVTGRVNLERNPDQRADTLPVDDLLYIADQALAEAKVVNWILFDRLDVAFSENLELERNALRALFRAYRDLRRFDHVILKLFIRDDVWDRITDEGFAEASHLVRSTTVTWDAGGLRNLLVRRLASSAQFLAYVGKTREQLMESAEEQDAVLQMVLPDKVDIGRNPATFDWMLSRVADGSKQTTPRELIHLMDEARTIQIARAEKGEGTPGGTLLFDRPVFKQALKPVSIVRYQQTFRAENPSMVKYTDALRGKKAEQTVDSLASLWEIDLGRAKEIAERLVELGFFEKRAGAEGATYWVPFVYRDALELVQGRADI